MILDIPTLLIVSALTTAVCGGVLLIAQDSRTDNESLRTWGLSMLMGAMGLVVAVIGVGKPFLQLGISTVLILLARGMGWSGARRFNNKRPMLFSSIAGGAVWGLALPFLPLPAWMAGACLIAIAYIVLMMQELRPQPTEKLRSRSLLLALLGLQVVIFAARAVMALAGGPPAGLANSILAAIVLVGMLHAIGAAMLMLALVKEQVERRAVLQMRDIAMADSLTNIGNRRFFDEQFPIELRRARRQDTCVGLLLIDVDHFKQFNDDFGHPEGDACLRRIADTIGQCIRRPGDLLARYGGEEFIVLLPDTNLDGATLVAETIRRTVMDLPRIERGKAAQVTVSVGISAMVPDGTDPDGRTLIAAADQALYAAKAAGRNSVRDHLHAALADAGVAG